MDWVCGAKSANSLLRLFIYQLGKGTTGAAPAFDITSWVVAMARVVYVIEWYKERWDGFFRPAFKEVWAFVRLSLASAVMLCVETWYMMSIIVLTRHLDDAMITIFPLS